MSPFFPSIPEGFNEENEAGKRQAEVGEARAAMEAAFALYRKLLAAGWPRELARSVLPVATYSHMFATVSLLNLLKFLTLRCDSHAPDIPHISAEFSRNLTAAACP